MHEFAEEYVANLKPRDERYDTRLGDDFYVATFPNGVKTWIYLYKVNDFTRRQTLGIYPEMPLPVALDALYAARRTRAVEADLASQGLDGSQLRDAENSPINLTATKKRGVRRQQRDWRFLAGAVCGLAVSALVGLGAWIFVGNDDTAEIPMTAAVADPVPPAIPPYLPVPAEPETENDPPESEPVVPDPQASDNTAELASVESDVAGIVEAEPPAELGESQQALMRLQQDLAGTLAWSQLTSGIRDGEPIDQLGWIVELEQRSRRVFYFVRVRGMAGREVRYIWRYEGQVLKEDAVQVGSGWHSPAYSGMTVTADRLGTWQVEVTSPDGRSLGSEQFEARLAGELVSRR